MIGLVVRYVSTLKFLVNYHDQLPVYVVFAGQTLTAIAQAFFLFAPTKLAAVWFPDNHRALANTIGSTSNPLGILVAFVASPMLVDTAKDIPVMVSGTLCCPCETLVWKQRRQYSTLLYISIVFPNVP